MGKYSGVLFSMSKSISMVSKIYGMFLFKCVMKETHLRRGQIHLKMISVPKTAENSEEKQV